MRDEDKDRTENFDRALATHITSDTATHVLEAVAKTRQTVLKKVLKALRTTWAVVREAVTAIFFSRHTDLVKGQKERQSIRVSKKYTR